MCAMTGFNVQSLVRYIPPLYIWEIEKILNEHREFSIWGEGFIRGQKVKSSGSQVVCSNVISHLLCNQEFVVKRSRTKCAMTCLNIHSHVWYIAHLAPWGEGVLRTGEGFVGRQEVRKWKGKLKNVLIARSS